MTVAFEATWPGTELGTYRPCGGTYERYPYSSVPILDASRFAGAFDWLPDPGTIDPAQVALLADLDQQLATVGLALPLDFVLYHTHTELSQTLVAVSGTGCFSTLLGSSPEESEDRPLPFRNYLIPSPVDPGAFLLQFLNDQQDCVTWYLYLRPTGETFVVHAYGLEFEVDDEGTPAYLRPGTFPPFLSPHDYEAFAKIFWCAPSFEQFAYRFWIENRILHALVITPEEPLAADLQVYLEHYRRAQAAPESGQ